MKQRSAKEAAEVQELSAKIARLESLLLSLPPQPSKATPAAAAARLPSSWSCTLGTLALRLLGLLLLLRLLDLSLSLASGRTLTHRGGSVILSAVSQRLPLLLGRSLGAAGQAAAAAAAAAAPPPPPAAGRYWRGPAVTVQSLQYGTELGDADYDGYFEKVLFKDTHGAYPLMIVADIFFHCPTSAVHVISRYYKRSPQAQNFSEMLVAVVEPATGAHTPLAAQGWHVESNYETSAVGIFPVPAARGPGGLCDPNPATRAPTMQVHVAFREASKTFTLAPPPEPQPPPTVFSMVAVFSFNHYMLQLWVDYWSLLGIETFYFFYNGPPEDIPALNASLSGLRAHVVWVAWPLLHWIITDATDITHGQPMAIVDALQRWRERSQYLFFYDLDEFLVLPRHSGLQEFMAEYSSLDHGRGPLVALRTQCSWAIVNLTLAPPGLTIADLNVTDFAVYPVVHGEPGGREKYWMNASARRVEHSGWGTDEFRAWEGGLLHNINLHGIYAAQDKDLAHVRILDWQGGRFPAYHIHLLNTRTPERTQDGRDIYFVNSKNKQVDGEIGGMVRRLIVKRRDASREASRRKRGGG